MHDDVLLSKAAIIERTIRRAREEYVNAQGNFSEDFTRQDAAILNVQRACEAAIDMGQYYLASKKLGLAQSSREIFSILAEQKVIPVSLAHTLQQMVGFRNSAVHEYQKILIPIVEKIILENLEDLLEFSSTLVKDF